MTAHSKARPATRRCQRKLLKQRQRIIVTCGSEILYLDARAEAKSRAAPEEDELGKQPGELDAVDCPTRRFCSLHSILASAKPQEPYSFYPSENARGSGACLKRIAALMGAAKAFASLVRALKVLTAAQIGRHSQKGPLSPWNALQHELTEGGKFWFTRQKEIHELLDGYKRSWQKKSAPRKGAASLRLAISSGRAFAKTAKW